MAKIVYVAFERVRLILQINRSVLQTCGGSTSYSSMLGERHTLLRTWCERIEVGTALLRGSGTARRDDVDKMQRYLFLCLFVN